MEPQPEALTLKKFVKNSIHKKSESRKTGDSDWESFYTQIFQFSNLQILNLDSLLFHGHLQCNDSSIWISFDIRKGDT